MRFILILIATIAAFVAGIWYSPVGEQVDNGGQGFEFVKSKEAQIENVLDSHYTEIEKKTIAAYQATNQSVVFISTVNITRDPFSFSGESRPEKGSGSGVVIDRDKGLIVTNLHVINNAQKIEILLADNLRYPATLVGYDEVYDLAVLKLKTFPNTLHSVPLGDSDSLQVGQQVLAIGNPFGLNRSLTTGIISSLDRTLKTPEGKFLQDLIQTDAAINPGNSGGPLLDLNGKLVGINTIILSQSGDSAGIGFAIPINILKKILPDLIRNGKVLRANFGWLLVDTKLGVMVRRVDVKSVSHTAKIKPLEYLVKNQVGYKLFRDYENVDFILAINGRKVSSKQAVQKIIENLTKGQAIKLMLAKLTSSQEVRTVDMEPEWK